MNTESFKRKLTAVYSADVVGYSRLMGEDEAATVETITAYRKIMGTLIKQHRGRMVDSPGDNVLAEFASVVDAVQCAVAVQKEFQSRNTELPENRRMEFRIGVNLGDVIEEGERIYGDGVNIAARLEALADTGGICISKTAFDHIESKLPLGYEFLGEQTVKNIAKPVGAYRVLMEPRITVAGADQEEKVGMSRRRRRLFFGVAAVLLVVIGLGVWYFYLRAPRVELASVEKMAIPLSDKPSIAVLPFENMSDDSGQEYLSDGITESIIMGLSNVPDMLVISRNSTFAYKGKPIKIKQVGEELGVRYVLEGSVQREGDSIRITAQFIDATTDNHLWAERYDRKMEDLFALQDEITIKVLETMQIKLTRGELLRGSARGTNNLEAYLKFLQGYHNYWLITREHHDIARQKLKEAIAMDPKYAAPYALLGQSYLWGAKQGWSKTPQKTSEEAFKLAQKALSLDESLPVAYALLSWFYNGKRDYNKAIDAAEKAIALNPNSGQGIMWLGNSLRDSGRPHEAIPLYKKALRIDPLWPFWNLSNLASAYGYAGMYEEMIPCLEKVLQISSKYYNSHLRLALAYAAVGEDEKARASVKEALKRNPKYTLEQYKNKELQRSRNQDDVARELELLRKAGLPE